MIIKQYLIFLLNGGLLGLAAIAFQYGIFVLIGSKTGIYYSIASAITYIPLIVINFTIQKSVIFSSEGRLSKFLIANSIVMVFVSSISPFCRYLLAMAFGEKIGDSGGFIFAALIGATPSFLLMRLWVFRSRKATM